MIPAGLCFSAIDPLGFIVDSALVGYDGGWNVRDEERSVDQQQQSRWWKRFLWTGGMIAALVVLLILIRIGYAYPWTGFGQYKVNGDVQPAKTLWDWLKLLIVPTVLAIGGYLFTRSESRATQAATEQQAQDDALQAYLDQMSHLHTDANRPLHRAQPGDNLSTVVCIRHTPLR